MINSFFISVISQDKKFYYSLCLDKFSKFLQQLMNKNRYNPSFKNLQFLTKTVTIQFDFLDLYKYIVLKRKLGSASEFLIYFQFWYELLLTCLKSSQNGRILAPAIVPCIFHTSNFRHRFLFGLINY